MFYFLQKITASLLGWGKDSHLPAQNVEESGCQTALRQTFSLFHCFTIILFPVLSQSPVSGVVV